MKFLAILTFVVLSSTAFAEWGVRLMAMPFRIQSDTVDEKLTVNDAKFNFQIGNAEFLNPPFAIRLKTAVNGVWKEVLLNADGTFSYDVEPGKYIFQFYMNQNFQEIKSTEVEIKPKHVISVDLYFPENYFYGRNQIEVDKPVIYLHTSEQRDFEIGVTPKEAFSFVYPEMNGSWKGTAETNGSLTIKGENYPYLFWESKQEYQFKSEGNGYKVEKDGVVAFLEKKLTQLGLSQQEKTDFITYWGPKLAANETSFVQFSIDESCDQFASMNVVPAPTAVRRVYIQLAKWEPQFEQYLNDVTFESFEPSDWYIVEWGGFSFSLSNLTSNGN